MENQIEQFIESIYPSQDPKAIALKQQTPAALEKTAKQKAAEEEAKWDTSTLAIPITSSMSLTPRLSLHAPCCHGHSLLPLLPDGESVPSSPQN